MSVLTHYGVIAFSGDIDAEHPDPELQGCGPSLQVIACGPAQYCWAALAEWTTKHPLRMWEHAEVLLRLVEADQ